MSLTALQMVNELLSRFGLKEVGSLGASNDATIALRKINLAQKMIFTAHPFKWAEKNDPGQIAAVAGTAVYNLASDVAHVIAAKHIYQGGAPIYVVDRATLENYRPSRSDSSQRNVPTHITTAGVSQASASSTPLIRAEIWPVPDANFDSQIIYYYYTFLPTDLAGASDISLIPGDFDWLLVDLAEILQRGGPIRIGGEDSQIDLALSIVNARYKKGLADLISRDSAIGAGQMSWVQEGPTL